MTRTTHTGRHPVLGMLAPALAVFALGNAGCAGEVEDGLAVDGPADTDARSRPLERPGDQDDEALLDVDEAADLVYMREEEKLARDVYLTLYDAHGLTVHKQIAASEQRHTDAIDGLLDRYDMQDPVVDDTVGVFYDAHLDALYDDLVAWGLESKVDALLVGATIEDLDMVDIAGAMTRVDDQPVLDVYDSLICGSRNHLRAFVGQLEDLGETYTATFMDGDEMDAILADEREDCG